MREIDTTTIRELADAAEALEAAGKTTTEKYVLSHILNAKAEIAAAVMHALGDLINIEEMGDESDAAEPDEEPSEVVSIKSRKH